MRPASMLRAAAAAALLGVVAIAHAPAASAHATGGHAATDWTSRVTGVRPGGAGLDARVTDLGDHVVLRASGRLTVVVLGYADEPYLRIGPRGVDENLRSPAVFLNRASNAGSTAVPKQYDADAAPRWVHLTDAREWRWHDHRAHHGASGSADEPFTIPLVVGGQPGAIDGVIVHVTAPNPIVPFAIALVALAAAFLVDGARRAGAVLAALAVLGVVLVIAVAQWGTEGWTEQAGGVVYAAVAAIAAATAAGWCATRRDAWAPATLLGGVAVVVAGGFTFVDWLVHSELPSALPAALSRAVVALLLGGGAGCVIAGARRLRPAPLEATPVSPPTRSAAPDMPT